MSGMRHSSGSASAMIRLSRSVSLGSGTLPTNTGEQALTIALTAKAIARKIPFGFILPPARLPMDKSYPAGRPPDARAKLITRAPIAAARGVTTAATWTTATGILTTAPLLAQRNPRDRRQRGMPPRWFRRHFQRAWPQRSRQQQWFSLGSFRLLFS